MKVGKSTYEIAHSLDDIWKIIELELGESIEWIEPSDWMQNGSYLLPLEDGVVDVMDDLYTLMEERWIRFRLKFFKELFLQMK